MYYYQKKVKKSFGVYEKSSIFAACFEEKKELFERLTEADVTQLVE